MNLLAGQIVVGGVAIGEAILPLVAWPRRRAGGDGRPASRAFRASDDGPLALRVELLERLGADTIVHGRLPDDTRLVARAPGANVPLGGTVRLAISPEHVHLFDRETGRRFDFVKDLVILGGPNGAGKTTAAARLLPHDLGIREFVNADEIARGLPFNPEGSAIAAGRLMLERMRALICAAVSFAFETTCSGRRARADAAACRAAGYRLDADLSLAQFAGMAVARVAGRVVEGGRNPRPT